MKKSAILFFLFTSPLLFADDFTTLTDYMTGSFSSARQAEQDSTFFDIRLEMVQIWPNRDDGAWLYVEQAAATHLDQPYRQRIYHVTQIDEKTFQSKIFEFPNALEYAGAWKEPEKFAHLKANDLIAREGCAVILKKQTDGSFSGSTIEQACRSEHRGASYATSIVTIEKNRMTSWDRGYDADGK